MVPFSPHIVDQHLLFYPPPDCVKVSACTPYSLPPSDPHQAKFRQILRIAIMHVCANFRVGWQPV